MLKLKNLHIKRFRNVKPGTRLDFADGFNVLLGKNGAGKTTLLRLLEAIAVSSFAPFKDEAFDLDYEWAGDEGRVLVHVENVRREQPAELDPAFQLLDRAQANAEYAAQLRVVGSLSAGDGSPNAVLETKDGRTTLRLQGKHIALAGTPMLPTSEHFLAVMMATLISRWSRGPKIPKLFLHLVLNEARRFDESLGYYAHIKALQFSELPPHSVPSVAFNGHGSLSLTEAQKTSGGGTTLSFNIYDIPFLATFIGALGGIKTAELQLNIASKETTGASRYGGLRVWLTRLDGSGYSDDKLSYGQKRLFSFLYYLAANEHTVIADELVNGLHHDWIDLCVKEIGDRQAFLTSQNPLLMDHLSFESIEDVRRAFVLCQLAYEGDSEVLHWRNMTPEEAGGVFEAGEVGIEHLSTILRNEGLW